MGGSRLDVPAARCPLLQPERLDRRRRRIVGLGLLQQFLKLAIEHALGRLQCFDGLLKRLFASLLGALQPFDADIDVFQRLRPRLLFVLKYRFYARIHLQRRAAARAFHFKRARVLCLCHNGPIVS